MANPEPSFQPFSARAALGRLRARAPLVFAAVLVLGGLASFAGLSLLPALIGFCAFVLAAAVLPDPERAGAPAARGPSELGPDIVGIFAFADALPDPCFILDRREVVVHRNEAGARQFPAVLPNRPLALALRNPELVRAIEAADASGSTRTVELHETVPSETWHKIIVAPLRMPGRDWRADEGRLLSVSVQNLTELKRVEAMRTDFIANASHELRTPLASLLGFIETLQGPAAKDAAAREKFLAIMRGQAERMARLIEDLLSLSRIEMHQHLRPTDKVDLVPLLAEVCAGLEKRAADAGLAIALTLEGESAIAIGEREQLYEVFENLIDNAIKYGEGGERIEVALARTDRPGLPHRVSVTDHGQGVAEEHVPRLTERFYRAGAEAGRQRKGTGLGLAIVKHIVTRHRGQMAIRSRPGEGMRVDILLPG